MAQDQEKQYNVDIWQPYSTHILKALVWASDWLGAYEHAMRLARFHGGYVLECWEARP